MANVRLWLRSVLLRASLERDMQEEMSAHLARAAARFEASGMSADDARRAAQREFGNVDAIQEEARDARGGRGIESVLADMRYGVRCLARTPATAVAILVVFSLGIGFNAALFLFISSLVNSPLPGMSHDPSRVRIRGVERQGRMTVGREFSFPEYRDYASQTTLFEAVAAWTSSDVVIGGCRDQGGEREALVSGAATYVTANYFQVLGVHLTEGAGLPMDAPDVGGEPRLMTVISHVVWDRCFGRASDVVGRAMTVNGTTVSIAGVAPRRFAGARTGGSQMRVWLPLNTRPIVQRATTDLTSYGPAFLGLAARLRPGVHPTDALPTVQAIGARSTQLTTEPHSGGMRSTDVVPMLAGNYFPPSGETPDVMGRAASLLFPLLVLLVTCTSVSTLLAGLAIARRREIAVRLSLGASRRRVVRQLVTESVLLAVAAGALALLVIWALVRFVESTVAEVHVVVDWRVLLFTLGVALVAGVVFGLSPALHGTRVPLTEVLKDSTAGLVAPRSRLTSGLVVAQIALTQPLLLGMSAFILELREDLGRVPAPVHADRVLDVRFNTNPRYGAIDEARQDTLRRLQDRLAAVPGVAGVVSQEEGDDVFDGVVHQADRIGDQADRRLNIRAQAAPAGYFSLLGIPIVRGRELEDPHREDPAAVVIGAATAHRLWPGTDPIGRRLISLLPTPRGNVFTVVGVIDETTTGSSTGSDEVRIFVPNVRVTGRFLIRTEASAHAMAQAIRAVALAEAPGLPIVSVRTLDAIEAEERTSLSRAIAAIGGAGALALFLSAMGLYAVVALAVHQRVREIGVRTALGADRRQVVRWFLMRGLRLSVFGMALGLTLSVIVVRLMAAMRGEALPSGVVGSAAVVACVAIAVTLVATWIPARRAATIDPLLVLRAE